MASETMDGSLTRAQAYSTTIYMGVFGGSSPKRHRLYSNDHGFLEKLSEKAGYMSRAEQAACPVKITKKYRDRSGVLRCQGLKKEMRESACLVRLCAVTKAFTDIPLRITSPSPKLYASPSPLLELQGTIPRSLGPSSRTWSSRPRCLGSVCIL